jgi:hypothetical protein
VGDSRYSGGASTVISDELQETVISIFERDAVKISESLSNKRSKKSEKNKTNTKTIKTLVLAEEIIKDLLIYNRGLFINHQ